MTEEVKRRHIFTGSQAGAGPTTPDHGCMNAIVNPYPSAPKSAQLWTLIQANVAAGLNLHIEQIHGVEGRAWVEALIAPIESMDATRIVHEAARQHKSEWLDLAVMEAAINWASHQLPSPDLVSVNAMHGTISHTGFPAFVRRLLDAAGMPPNRLCIEISEMMPPTDVRASVDNIRRLRRQGVRFAVDDIGSGWSNLTLAAAAGVEIFKVDMSLLWASGHCEQARAMLHGLKALAACCDAEIVIEGVETPAHAKTVAELGGAASQGYLYGRPVRVCTCRASARKNHVLR
jgi:EAL domain-containing protein (putative c-di-GMP-specific phosphodiesterase class I)